MSDHARHEPDADRAHLLPPPDRVVNASRSVPQATPEPRDPAGPSLYDRVGGEEFFRQLVDAFYDIVATDPVLRPVYPEEDLSGARERLRMFLVQFWGGPTTYSQQRGHPRLRMRHAPFPVGTAQIEAWLAAMESALDTVDPDEEVREELWAYFQRAAHFMRNVEG